MYSRETIYYTHTFNFFFMYVKDEVYMYVFFFQAEDGIRDGHVTGVQTCALPISQGGAPENRAGGGAATGYTETIGDLLAVNSEIGIREAGDDAGLLRAVAASAAFSRAKELADRERLVAAQASSLGRLDDRARMRLASMSGRQDALLDLFNGLAGSEQRALSARLLARSVAPPIDELRRAALDGRARGAHDLAAWSAAAAARVEAMRTVEVGLVGEVGRLARRAESAADRRAALYGAALLLALLLGPVLMGSGSRSDRPKATRQRAAEGEPA